MTCQHATEPRKAAKEAFMPTQTTANSDGAKIRSPTLVNIFAKTPKLQNASPLLNMPAELRLKVLRYLMKNDGPIPDFETTWVKLFQTMKHRPGENERTYKKRHKLAVLGTYQFSSQILPCCQQLYQESRYVLYKENCVTIQSFDWSLLSTLNCNIAVSGLDSIKPYRDIDLLASSLPPRSHQFVGDSPQQIYPALSEFDSFIVILNITNRKAVYKLARMFKYLLYDKTMLVTVKNNSRYIRHGIVDVNWLSSFRIWRCKEIEFTSHQGSKVDELVRLITCGDKSTRDEAYELDGLHDIYKNLRKRKHINSKDATNSLAKLEEAIMSYNSKLVKKHKEGFLKAAKEAVENGKDTRRKALEEEKTQMEKDHDELLGSISNCN